MDSGLIMSTCQCNKQVYTNRNDYDSCEQVMQNSIYMYANHLYIISGPLHNIQSVRLEFNLQIIIIIQ